MPIFKSFIFMFVFSIFGCDAAEYRETLAGSQFFSTHVTSEIMSSTSAIGICQGRNEWRQPVEWFATIKLVDGSIYHYRLTWANSDAHTAVMLKNKEFYVSSGKVACLKGLAPYLINFSLRQPHVTVKVNSEVALKTSFDESVKMLFVRAAIAASMAIKENSAHPRPEQSWGLQK